MSNNRNEEVLKAFGENLKKLREARGLTTRQFADLADIAYSQVWTLESGQGDPTLTTLWAIAKALNIKLEELYPVSSSWELKPYLLYIETKLDALSEYFLY